MKKFLLAILVIEALSALTACVGKKEEPVTLKVSSRFVNDMIYVEPGSEEATTETEPVPEEYTVKAGDVLGDSGITVKKIRGDQITIETYFDFSGHAYRDGELVRSYDAATTFTFQRGESLTLYDVSILDASHTVWIESE